MRIPHRSPAILKFAGDLSRSPLRSVPVYPKSWANVGNCIPNVQRAIYKKGGTMLLGWRLWEWPCVFVEAEFHAVWQMKDGNLQDPTPNQWKEAKVRFVHDPSANFVEDFAYPNNILKPLVDDELVVRFVESLRAKNAAEFLGNSAVLEKAQGAVMRLYSQVSDKFGKEPRMDQINQS